MRTDKQMYKILEACPDWFFDLTQIANPGPCSFPSMALKEVEVTADGVLEPQAVDQPFFLYFRRSTTIAFMYVWCWKWHCFSVTIRAAKWKASSCF